MSFFVDLYGTKMLDMNELEPLRLNSYFRVVKFNKKSWVNYMNCS